MYSYFGNLITKPDLAATLIVCGSAVSGTLERFPSTKSSYRLKTGFRPGGFFSPEGVYDGAFNADYEYIEKSRDLYQCNGTNVITPEFKEGTYAYFLTANWPVVPRCFAGDPDSGFNICEEPVVPRAGVQNLQIVGDEAMVPPDTAPMVKGHMGICLHHVRNKNSGLFDN